MKLVNKIKIVSLLPLILWGAGLGLSVIFYLNATGKIEEFFATTLKKQNLITKVYNDIGYGNGIHAFKNYLIRGDEVYARRALKKFKEALRHLEQIENDKPLTIEEKEALRLLRKAIHQYIEKLEIARKMKRQNLSVVTIDKAVKIDERPAVEALEKFQEQFNKNQSYRVTEIENARASVLLLILLTFFVSFATAFVVGRRYSGKVIRSLKLLGEIAESIELSKFEHNRSGLEKIEEIEIKSIAVVLIETSEKLRKTILNLQKSNDDLEHFSFVAAHNLQEPIRKISNFADMIVLETKGSLGDEIKVYITKIKKTSLRMSNLVRSLLEYSRLAKEEVKLEPVDLNDVVSSVIAELNLEIRGENASIEVQKLPYVYGNKKLLSIGLNHLVSNAIKFKKRGEGAVIKIYAEYTEKDASRIVIEDQGVGIDERSYGDILKPFVRGHVGGEEPGIGIGLSVVKRILALHDSELTVSSVVGVGSKFSFRLSTL